MDSEFSPQEASVSHTHPGCLFSSGQTWTAALRRQHIKTVFSLKLGYVGSLAATPWRKTPATFTQEFGVTGLMSCVILHCSLPLPVEPKLAVPWDLWRWPYENWRSKILMVSRKALAKESISFFEVRIMIKWDVQHLRRQSKSNFPTIKD